MPFGRVYLLRNQINGKVYVGQTITFGPIRFSKHISAAQNGSDALVHRAIRRFGVESFREEHLAYAESRDDLNRLEVLKIKEFHALDPDRGYNQQIGGRHREEQVKTEERHPDFWVRRAVKLAEKIRRKYGLEGIRKAQTSELFRSTTLTDSTSEKFPSKRPSVFMVQTWNSERKATDVEDDSVLPSSMPESA